MDEGYAYHLTPAYHLDQDNLYNKAIKFGCLDAFKSSESHALYISNKNIFSINS
jgi:hypothetical protein